MIIQAITTKRLPINAAVASLNSDVHLTIAIEAVEWYNGKRIEEMDLEEFLNGLKGMWLTANYFRKIDKINYDEGAIQMTFNHDLTKDYGKFWAEYFKTLLENNWNCLVQKSTRNESFYLIIRQD